MELRSNQQAIPAETLPSAKATGELDLFGLGLLLRSRLRFILLCAVAGFILVAAFTLYVKPRYEAETSVIIPQVNPSAAGLVLQAASGLDLVGGGFEVYVDLLRSRRLAEHVIQSNDLAKRWHSKDMDGAVNRLESEVTITAAKEGLLKVVVQDEDRNLAPAIANSFLTELDRLNHELALTSASSQRKYFEEKMVEEKNSLEQAEAVLQQTQEKTGVLEPQLQATANLGATEQVRAQLLAKRVALQALLQGETPQNSEVKRAQAEIGQLEGQLNAMTSGSGGLAAGNPASKVPGQALAYVRALREVKFHEAMFESLQKQDELSKAQESKDFSQLEILDHAEVPLKKAWPPRARYSLAGFFLGGILGVVITLLRAFARTVMSNPDNQARYRQLASGKRA